MTVPIAHANLYVRGFRPCWVKVDSQSVILEFPHKGEVVEIRYPMLVARHAADLSFKSVNTKGRARIGVLHTRARVQNRGFKLSVRHTRHR